MKVGDLVRFKDASSWADQGHGSFKHLDGSLALVMGKRRCPSGNPMVVAVIDGQIHTFNRAYFEVVNESR